VGRLKLLECLHWSPFDEEEEPQKSIALDYLYECIRFCADKHFPACEICHYFDLAYDMINCSKCKLIYLTIL